MLTNKRNLVLAFFSVLLFAFALNTLNVSCIRNQTDKSNEFLNKNLVFNQTIFSIDNSWYLPQIHNFLAGKGFTCDTTDRKLAVRRTPVYPMFYGAHYLLFGEKNSFFVIKITQTFLFALSAIAFLLAVFYFTDNKKIAWFSFFLYGFNPTLISYTYYTITEALSPALICFMLYFFSKSIKSNTLRNWFFTGISFSLAALCRPTVFIFGASIALAIFHVNRTSFKKILTSAIAFGCAFLLIFTPYVIRNYKVTDGDFVLLEKYYNDPMDYGMQNIEFRKWISTWINPADYNSERVSNKMISCIKYNAGHEPALLDSLMNTIPPKVFSSYSKEEVRNVYLSLFGFYKYKFGTSGYKNIDSAETQSVNYIRLQTEDYIKRAPVHHYIIMPLLFFKSIVAQSNSATMTYLDNYNTNKLAYIVKLLLILLNVYLFFSLAGNLIYLKRYLLIYLIIFLFVAINCGYMLFVINYFEARYLVPLFPLLYISGAIFAVETLKSVREKLNF